MTLPRVLLILAAFAFAHTALAEVLVGQSREEVLQQIGKPTSRASRGGREFFMYPNGGRVEFEAGKVVDIKGPLPSAPAVTVVAESPSAEATAKDAARGAAPTTKNASPNVPGNTTTAAEPVWSPAAGVEGLSKAVERMDTAWGERPPAPPADEPLNWPRTIASLLLHFGVTLLALKIAFKFEEMDAFWSGVLAIAAIDLAVHGLLEALGPVTYGISTAGGVQSGIGALVMVGTIQKFCFNKRLQNAVITAMSVKLVVYLCELFLFVLLLNVMFG